jgi:PKD repeat protein
MQLFALISSSIAGNVEYIYDDMNRLKTVIYGDDKTRMDYSYDEVGNRESESINRPPVSGPVGSPTSGTVPLKVYFKDNSTNDPNSWMWGFGDGGTSSARNPSYVFRKSGTYTVSLTAANIAGSGSANMVGYITVTPCSSRPVRIAGTGPVYYGTIQSAYDAATTGQTIQSMGIDFMENLSFKTAKTIILDGGYDCGYASGIGQTYVNGNLMIGAGNFIVTLGNVILDTKSEPVIIG